MHAPPRLLLALLLLASPLASAEEWDTYLNNRFGFSLSFPAQCKGSAPPDERSGRKFVSRNKEFVLEVEGGLIGSGTLESYWENSLAHYGDTITYKVKKKDWYVVSGVRHGGEYYNKVHVKGGNWSSFMATYLHANNKKYDPWVARIAKSFKPFLEGNFERAGK